MRTVTLRLAAPGIAGMVWLAIAAIRALLIGLLAFMIARDALRARTGTVLAIAVLAAFAGAAAAVALGSRSAPVRPAEPSLMLRGSLADQRG